MEIEVFMALNALATAAVGSFQIYANRRKTNAEAEKTNAEASKMNISSLTNLADALTVSMQRSLEQNQISIDMINAREFKNDELKEELSQLRDELKRQEADNAAQRDKMQSEIKELVAAGVAKDNKILELETKIERWRKDREADRRRISTLEAAEKTWAAEKKKLLRKIDEMNTRLDTDELDKKTNNDNHSGENVVVNIENSMVADGNNADDA